MSRYIYSNVHLKGSYIDFSSIGLNNMELIHPINATDAARRYATTNEPAESAITPATVGATAWPIPKKSVIKPNAAGESLCPTTSPQKAAIIVGILHAVIPNSTAERISPVLFCHKANKLYEMP